MSEEGAPAVETLERGSIYFLFRPRVEEEEPEGLEDVQNLFVVLAPRGKDWYRRAIVGTERLPDPEERQRFWGFVHEIHDRAEGIAEELGEETYRTGTRGVRHQPAARPVGEGVYRIVRHEGHTHLVYALDRPAEPDEVQEALNVRERASLILTVKNPEASSPAGAGLPDREAADFPPGLQEVFRGRRFVPAEPPELLDYPGCEFVLISASAVPEAELGLEIGSDAGPEDVFEALRLDRDEHPPEPLETGEWA